MNIKFASAILSCVCAASALAVAPFIGDVPDQNLA